MALGRAFKLLLVGAKSSLVHRLGLSQMVRRSPAMLVSTTLVKGSHMQDRIVVPRHLLVLAARWCISLKRLHVGAAAPLRIPVGLADASEAAVFTGYALEELGSIKQWMASLTSWFGGPLAAALENPGISDQEMHATAGYIDGFVDELVERRARLQLLAAHPSFAKLAPRLDAVYASLIEQLRDSIAAVVNALGPGALNHPNGVRQGNNIELCFVFRPDVSVPMADVQVWMASSRAAIEAGPMRKNATAGLRDTKIAAGSRQKPVDAPALAALVVLLVILVVAIAAISLIGLPGALILVALIALLVFIVRHPVISMIAVLLGLG